MTDTAYLTTQRLRLRAWRPDELAAADSAFLRAARDSWQGLFTTNSHQNRRRQLDAVLKANSAERTSNQ